MLFQYHLKGRHFSGRGVRVRMLDPMEVDQNAVDAGKLIDVKSTVYELKMVEWRNGVKSFISEITEPCDDLTGAKWRKVTVADMDQSFNELFTAKDFGVLERLYRDLHEVSDSEIDAIVGKALPVSSEG